ncbi:pyridoxal 5'-phosphate synthase glutaminase subunit PdxT [Arthrobacter sp. H5]|uniref:pyridoxal 5'-phosphate synthase glutaminase subunit PdxT n=1 Tax=Arthrobacter sp. H5 TaxID=1267973 RepID=UPI0004841EFC|nr:pyridoxal 5'-phosphate synthase glutaminase subunit PdxT [Arthrobacter sp. H5]
MTSATQSSSTAARVGVLAVQGDVREHIRVVESLGGIASAVRRHSELDGLDGLIIPGGESTTMDKLTRAFELAEPLRRMIRGGFPVYGSCAGMIMLADAIADPSTDRQGNPQQTLGGLDIVVRRNAFGRQRESFERDVEFAGLPGRGTNDGGAPVHAVFIRAPWVESVGESVQILAQVEAGDTPPAEHGGAAGPEPHTVARIVAVRSGNLLATSFHPEVTGEHRIHELFLSMISERRATHVGAL